LHDEVCMQVPEPDGVEQGLLVQHFTSLEPGHNPLVVVPEQQPAETETHTLNKELMYRINNDNILAVPFNSRHRARGGIRARAQGLVIR
jgi:hypothetical protein